MLTFSGEMDDHFCWKCISIWAEESFTCNRCCRDAS